MVQTAPAACLMLHGIGPVPSHVPPEEVPYWVAQTALATILAAMEYHPLSLTFDDGNASDAEIALPMLIAAGQTASFFIPSERIDTPGYLSADAIRALHQAGMQIGSHGAVHRPWTTMTDAEIAADITASNAALQAIIGAPVTTAAIPYGFCNRRVLNVVRRLGITRLYSSFRGPDRGARWLVRRDCIMADHDEAAITDLITRKTAPAVELLIQAKIWRRAGYDALRPLDR